MTNRASHSGMMPAAPADAVVCAQIWSWWRDDAFAAACLHRW